MRKFIVIAALAAVAAMSLPAQAAVNTVVAGPGAFAAGVYATPAVVVAKAAAATFVNADPAPHDVVSDDKNANGTRKFKSGVIGIGATSPIVGVATLAPGDYGFFCSIHPSMKGTITIVA